MKIQGSTVLITGSNRGLGARLAHHVLAQGATRVYAGCRSLDALPSVMREDPRVVALVLDVTDADSVKVAAATAVDVQLVINNAGVLAFGDALTVDLAAAERDLSVNYLGLLRVSQAFAPALTQGAKQSPTALVNVLTLIALAPVPGMAAYCASKAAAHSITQALRASLGPAGVEVLGAYPGGIDTDMLAGVDADKADPDTVARRILAGIESATPVIWPDDASAGAGSVYLTDPVALEGMLAG